MELLIVWVAVAVYKKGVKVRVFANFDDAKKFKKTHTRDYETMKIMQTEVY